MALTHDRANPYINPSNFPGECYPVTEGGSSYAGGLCGLNAAGYLDKIPGPATNNASFRFRGVAHRAWSNPDGDSGAFFERVDRPEIIQGLKILGTDPVTQADVGNEIFLEDDETIRRTSNTSMRCSGGMLEKLNSDGTADIKPPQP